MSSFHCSDICITEVHVKSLEMEPGRNSVLSAVTGVRFSTSENPYPLAKISLPSFTTEMVAPAMFSRCNCDGITPSRNASISGAVNSCLSAVSAGASFVSGGAGVLADLGGVVSFTVCVGDTWANRNPADTQIHRLIARIDLFM